MPRVLSDILDDIAKEAMAFGDQSVLDLVEEATHLQAAQPYSHPQEEEFWNQGISYVNQAISSLASASVSFERGAEFTSAPIGTEMLVWFVVRSLCREFGRDYDGLVESARRHTPNPHERTQQ